jgi:hypothetical protein
VESYVALLPCLAAALLLAAAAAAAPVRRAGRLAAAAALVPAAVAALLVVWVLSEDTYRRNGISRWDAYRSPGGALGPLLVVSVVLLGLCAAALAVCAFVRRDRLYRLTALLGTLVVCFLAVPAVIGFSVN